MTNKKIVQSLKTINGFIHQTVDKLSLQRMITKLLLSVKIDHDIQKNIEDKKNYILF